MRYNEGVTATLPSGLETKAAAARSALDAWVREVVPGTSARRPARPSGWSARSARASTRATRSRATPTSHASAPSRTSGCAAARCGSWVPKGLRGPAGLRLRDGRLHRRAQGADQHRRLPHSTTRRSARRCPDEFFPKGADWLHGGPERAAPPAPGRRAPLPSTAAGSASWSTSTRAGSSSSSRWARWPDGDATSST